MSKTKLTAEELAPLLEVDKRKIYRLAGTGKLTAKRDLAGRITFDPADVAADYKRAGVELPAPMAAYLAPTKRPAAKPRAETRGAA